MAEDAPEEAWEPLQSAKQRNPSSSKATTEKLSMRQVHVHADATAQPPDDDGNDEDAKEEHPQASKCAWH